MTPLTIFEDVSPAVIQFDGVTPEAIARGISDVLDWTADQRENHLQRAGAWRKGHRHSVITQRLEGLLSALMSAGQADF